FIADYTNKLNPVIQLLKLGINFSSKDWKPEHQEALDYMKEYLLKEPCLAPFRPDFDNILHTDASHLGLGCVFVQRNPKTGEEKPVYFLSRILTAAEMNYGISELEAAAVLFGIAVLRQYLIGKPFTVVTDHMPLREIARINQGNTRLTRMALKITQYQV